MVANLKPAKALGIAVPAGLLTRWSNRTLFAAADVCSQ
jgi:hypothetical protein